MINSAASFNADYSVARAGFCQAVDARAGTLHSVRHPENGPDGRHLFVDVAQFGARDATHMIVLISGTHGVEGFCGSGAQVDLLRRGECDRLPAHIGVLMIHAINPYGFAWIRRATHENIDLNRNWIDFDQALPANLGYRELHAALCPQQWNETTLLTGENALLDYARRHGPIAAKNALGAGQYEFSDGLYFGGHSPSWSRLVQTEILINRLAAARVIAIIDYHTGLGPWGLMQPLSPLPEASEGFRRATTWIGSEVHSTVAGGSVGADIGGDGLSAAARLLSFAEVTPIFLEFGTLPREKVVPAYRADNWLHAHGSPASPEAASIKQRLRDAYYGDSDDWKGMVAGQSLRVWRQIVASLASR